MGEMRDTLPVRHVCSLGSVCQSSRMLQDTGLKRESYPFDWTFSSPIGIERILDDDFGQFLQRDLFVGIGPTQCSHLVYGERMFNHHNPKYNEEHYAYFARCVGRFRALLANGESKLFVMTFPNLDNDAGSVESIKAQVSRLTVYLSSKTTACSSYVTFLAAMRSVRPLQMSATSGLSRSVRPAFPMGSC